MKTRERELASDRRTGRTARIAIHERHRHTLRSHWKPLAVVSGVALAAFAVPAWLESRPLERGMFLGAGVMSAAFTVVSLVVLSSGTAPLMMGALAEGWSVQELRRLRRDGWKLINHFGLGLGDHDHVLIGPTGLVLIETKWGGTPWDLDTADNRVKRALQQTAANAKQLTLWKDVRRHGQLVVEPVLALWGPAAEPLIGGPKCVSGVTVVAGQELRGWLLARQGEHLDEATRAAIFQSMDRHLVGRDRYEQERTPLPQSASQLLLNAAAAAGLAAAAYAASYGLFRYTNSLLLWFVMGAALMLGAEFVRARGARGWQARCFQLTLAVLYLFPAAALVGFYLRS